MRYLEWLPRMVKSMEAENRMGVTMQLGVRGAGSYCSAGTEFLSEAMRTFRRRTVAMVAQDRTRCHGNVHLKMVQVEKKIKMAKMVNFVTYV